MSTDFYRAFEDKYRGPRELIKARLRVYLQFLEPFKEIYPDAQAVDLGCGRGEWLELLNEYGFSVQGVDIDDGMLAVCRELNLRVQTGEALSYLKQLPNESQVIVSAFHLVEHIPFDDVQALVTEALRVLKPAGLLILETPNPENIVVGTSTFYLDPTHKRPIPPELLAFLPEFSGFHKVKILRLQESPEFYSSKALSLLDVLNGVSPDYAVVSQKAADNRLINLTRIAFEIEYGVTLERLATTFDLQTKQTAKLARHAEAQAQQAEEQAQQAISTIQALYKSRSWRITAPLRWFSHQARLVKQVGFVSRAKALVKKMFRPFIRRGIIFVNKRPVLRYRLAFIMKKLGLYNVLHSLYSSLSSQGFHLAKDTKAKYFFTASKTSAQFNVPGLLSVDVILARIRTELENDKKESK